jgi:hypothetical protein
VISTCNLQCYAAFFYCLTFAHFARWNAATFVRAAADIVRFTGAEAIGFASATGCDVSRAFAHPAFCARAILRREAADMTRIGCHDPNGSDTNYYFATPITWLSYRRVIATVQLTVTIFRKYCRQS